jgi:hypothetical protein
MRTILIFVGVYILSLIAAYTVGIQLADYFFLQEEFIAVLFVLEIYSLVAIVAFAAVYVVARNVRWLGYTAIVLGVLALIITELPALADAFARRSTNPALVGSAQDKAIAASLLLPASVMLLIQWPLLRRRWLVARGLDHRMTWPWITTAVAGGVGLNRLGIEIVGAAVSQSATDWFAELWLYVALGAAGILVIAGLIEWQIRRRWIARRVMAA